MNWIAGLILAALTVELLLNGLADFLNLRSAASEVPAGFQGFYDPDRYRQAQAYLAATTRLGWALAVFDALALLLFWFGGGFGILDGWVRGYGLGPGGDRGRLCGRSGWVEGSAVTAFQSLCHFRDRGAFRFQPHHPGCFLDGPG